ncbi:MAG: hypothetical protein VX463_05485, partial [Pseudomonadota bacterium]|nr:hypothetical protein [Pseudomonadota bacterium]
MTTGEDADAGAGPGAAMVLFYDIAGDMADHDDWHSVEHFHERLSVPGFLRATRWRAEDDGPANLVIYEVAGLEVATSAPYLARLNAPTAWTRAMMPRFRGMVRGFASVAAQAGFGDGARAASLRFRPAAGDGEGAEAALVAWIADTLLPEVAAPRGMAGARLWRPALPPPMTAEQALRGPDAALDWLLMVTAWDGAALDRALAGPLAPARLSKQGAEAIRIGRHALHLTATARDAALMTAP